MSLPTTDAYGAPSYGPIGRPPAGICFHTPENVDHTLGQAIAVANWQATSGNTSGGSYHGILGYDATRGGMDNPDAWVMVRSVPWDQAAGGITSKRTNPPWNPERYPWMRALLGEEAYRDPNRWLHQISLSGKAAWYEQNGYPSGLVTRVAEWVKLLEGNYSYDAILTLHRFWQTDRSDPGPENFADLVLDAYGRLSDAPEPEPPAEDPRIAILERRLAEKDAALERILTLRLPALQGDLAKAQADLDQLKASVTFTRGIE